jgi:hypothetical protein
MENRDSGAEVCTLELDDVIALLSRCRKLCESFLCEPAVKLLNSEMTNLVVEPFLTRFFFRSEINIKNQALN